MSRPLIVLLTSFALIISACSTSEVAPDEGAAGAITIEATPDEPAAEATDDPATDDPAGDGPAGDDAGASATTTPAPADESETPTTVELPPIPETLPLPAGDAPPSTAAPGPFGVGRQALELTDASRDRSLFIDVWYPIDPGTEGEPTEYTFIPGVSVPSDTALDAPTPSGEGPFPLVIYSHGSGGQSYIASFFTEHLASHGFVVAAPNHAGNTALDQVLGSTSRPSVIAVDRPLDVSFVIDELLGGANEFDAIVDAERIGVVGHSFGGYTAYATAAGLPPEGLDNPPVRDNDVRSDERVDAIVAMAPVSSFLPDNSLASITIPSMVITGTDDATTPLEPESTRPFQLVRSGYAYRVDLVDAGHQSFTDVCDLQVVLPTLENIPSLVIDTIDESAEDGCRDEQMNRARAQELTNRYVVAFLRAHVAGEELYRLNLTPDAAAADADVAFFSR